MNQISTARAVPMEDTPRVSEANVILDVVLELLSRAQHVSGLAESRLDTIIGKHRPEFPCSPVYSTETEYFNSLERPLRDIANHLEYIENMLRGIEL